MKTLHRAMMTGMLIAVLAIALGAIQPASRAVWAQHGQGDNPMDHLNALSEHLGLSAAQREALEGPFGEALVAMQELQRLHGEIAAELNDEQKKKFEEMVHQMMGGSMAHQQQGERPHGDGSH